MQVLRTFLLVSMGLALVACNGPTKAGKEARAQAKDRIDRTSSLIVYDQAKQSYEAGDFVRAYATASEAILRLPTESRYWVLRGRINLEMARLEAALADFQKAEEVKADDADAMYCQGIVHERWGKYDLALAAYNRASDTDTSRVAYPLAAAEVLVAQGSYDEAQAILEPKLGYFENSAPMHQLLGQIAMLRSDPKAAAIHFNRAMLIDPKIPMILENLVRAQFEAAEWGDCLQNVRRLQREAEGGRTPERMMMEARCLTMLDRLTDARNVFSEVTRLEPENVEAWIALAGVAWELGDVSRVQTSAQRVLRIAPKRFEAYVFLGLVEESKGSHDAARLYFEEAKKLAGSADDMPDLLLGLQHARASGQSTGGASVDSAE